MVHGALTLCRSYFVREFVDKEMKKIFPLSIYSRKLYYLLFATAQLYEIDEQQQTILAP